MMLIFRELRFQDEPREGAEITDLKCHIKISAYLLSTLLNSLGSNTLDAKSQLEVGFLLSWLRE